ncbi:Transport and Golgi organization protein 2, partial [Coemansia sp. RSA 532]
MCIAIWKLDDKAEATGDYSLVLAFNRDEYFDRPTRGFHIWESKPNICAPLDLKPPDEAHRGSWIGVNRKGRLAFLTNFRELVPHHDGKISRGALVRDFLLDDLVTPGGQHVQTHSSNRDAVIEYAEKVYNERELYDGFNLVLFDLLSEHKTAVYVSNRGQNEDGSRGSMCELDQGQVI